MTHHIAEIESWKSFRFVCSQPSIHVLVDGGRGAGIGRRCDDDPDRASGRWFTIYTALADNTATKLA